ncbi:hypothetical protein [Paraburkholderia tropica]|uniref:hypothetical protein n=1 Tax=Paraburkholderia tropica TaxID=92647 RepID=UPI00160CE914|nr:hypothetical protein [Paraburkholderia tropica]MBB2981768.1 hypothetical protein [Paraburkholderia tropica]
MKATIKADGTLVVMPETEIEAYALGRWSATNMTDWFTGNAKALPKFMLNCEQFPGALDPVVLPNFSHLMGRGHHE